MRNYLSLFVLICFPLFIWGQKVVAEYQIPEGVKWTVNGRGDLVYIANNAVVMQTDDGRILKQSVKSLGEIASFQTVNSLKFLLFSSEQQMICFLDNSLSNLNHCLDLDELGFNQVTQVAASAQSDKIWIYDEINSNLVLYSTLTNLQIQDVQNVRGMLDIKEVSQIVEYNNSLILIDRTKGMYFFDRFGTFENYISLEGVKHVEVVGKHLLILLKEELVEYKLFLDGTHSLTHLGYSQVKDFHYNGAFLYIQHQDKIEKISF